MTKLIKFSLVQPGQCFRYNSQHYIKTTTISAGSIVYNAITADDQWGNHSIEYILDHRMVMLEE